MQWRITIDVTDTAVPGPDAPELARRIAPTTYTAAELKAQLRAVIEEEFADLRIDDISVEARHV